MRRLFPFLLPRSPSQGKQFPRESSTRHREIINSHISHSNDLPRSYTHCHPDHAIESSSPSKPDTFVSIRSKNPGRHIMVYTLFQQWTCCNMSHNIYIFKYPDKVGSHAYQRRRVVHIHSSIFKVTNYLLLPGCYWYREIRIFYYNDFVWDHALKYSHKV